MTEDKMQAYEKRLAENARLALRSVQLLVVLILAISAFWARFEVWRYRVEVYGIADRYTAAMAWDTFNMFAEKNNLRKLNGQEWQEMKDRNPVVPVRGH